MFTAGLYLAQLSRISIKTNSCIRATQPAVGLIQPLNHVRHARGMKTGPPKKKQPNTKKNQPQTANKRKAAETKSKKRKQRTTFIQYDMRDAEQFSLFDAMRYLRAAEVGRPPTSSKYELALKLRSLKNGPVIRNRLRLPHPVKTDLRICVICPPDSKYAEAARAAGASLVGEETIFEAVKDGRIDFDRCICQTNSLEKMNKAGLGRILGPRGLMPSAKTGTVIKDPGAAVRDLVGGSEYREKLGVVRMAIGQLAFTPDEMQRNIKAFMDSVKKDIAALSEKINKEVVEVVLSSTQGPGFSLNGDIKSPNSRITPKELSTS